MHIATIWKFPIRGSACFVSFASDAMVTCLKLAENDAELVASILCLRVVHKRLAITIKVAGNICIAVITRILSATREAVDIEKVEIVASL